MKFRDFQIHQFSDTAIQCSSLHAAIKITIMGLHLVRKTVFRYGIVFNESALTCVDPDLSHMCIWGDLTDVKRIKAQRIPKRRTQKIWKRIDKGIPDDLINCGVGK